MCLGRQYFKRNSKTGQRVSLKYESHTKNGGKIKVAAKKNPKQTKKSIQPSYYHFCVTVPNEGP